MSAICFTVGAALPLLSAAFIKEPNLRLGILAGATTSEPRLLAAACMLVPTCRGRGCKKY